MEFCRRRGEKMTEKQRKGNKSVAEESRGEGEEKVVKEKAGRG